MMDDLLKMLDQDWRKDAACVGVDVSVFVTSAEQDNSGKPPIEALRHCVGCPVRVQCLNDGIKEEGVWGGTITGHRHEVRNGRMTAVQAMAAGDRLAALRTREERGLEGDGRIVCEVEGCDETVRVRDMCRKHSERIRRREIKRMSDDAALWRVRQVAADRGVEFDDVMSDCTVSDVVGARHEAMVLLRGLGWSYSAIGRLLGRDHSTVMAAIRKVAA